MRIPATALLLCTFTAFLGCAGGNSVAPTPSPVDTSLTGNWQIQTAAASPTLPLNGILLLGALQQQGAAVTGTFRAFYLSGFPLCGNSYTTPLSFTGTFDSSRNLTLTSADSTIKIQLLLPTTLTSFGNGTIQSSGTTCALANSFPAIAAQTASLTGTFTGAVAANSAINPAPPIPNGTAILTLTQSPTAQSDGQFPLTGTLNFAGGSCTTSAALTGTVSGDQVTLASTPTSPFTLSAVRLNAVTPPTATQLIASELFYSQGPCSPGLLTTSDYNGTLTRQ